MDEHGVDICIVSLTCPNCYWGGPDVSLEAARIMNDDMAAARTAHPDRLRWLASLPWQYEALALAELERCVAAGASGVMVLANIDGKSLTDPAFAPIWRGDRRAARCRCSCIRPRRRASADMDMTRFQLTASIGFTFDTSLAVARMIYDGFFDRYREAQDHRRARRRRAALSHLAHGSVLRQHSRVPREDLGASLGISAEHLRRRGGLLAGRARLVREDFRRRQRDLRLGLSAHHRRHAGLPQARQRARGRRARQGARRATHSAYSICSATRYWRIGSVHELNRAVRARSA